MFSGGFVGVDIFFVISGYLITGIIIREMSEGEFSLLTFYERRARRILPALTTLVLACLPVGWVMMMPDPMENFGQSVVATMLSANNILLTITNGYWDLASEFKPLLHTWSLAVEEQFYIVFPLILMAGWALLNERTIYIVVAITIASFLAAVLLNDRYPTSSFYLLHTRAWELGIGAVGAFITQHRDFRNNDLLAGTGLILIAYSVFFFDGSTPFPSSYTLVPVVGAFLTLLFARSDGWVGKLLSIGALQWVGLISYSLYLWHQPIFAFARVYSFEEPSWIAYLALIALCFVLAYLSWRYVEKPFRVKGKISTKAVFASAAGNNSHAFRCRAVIPFQPRLSPTGLRARWRILLGHAHLLQ